MSDYGFYIIHEMVEAVSPLKGKPKKSSDFMFDIPGYTGSITFQKDGTAYIVSKDAFGQLGWGLRTHKRANERGEVREIENSKRIIVEVDHKGKIIPDEKPFVEPLLKLSDKISLKDINETVEQLADLGDDGLVRMVDGKYAGRAIKKDKYREYMLEKENEMLQTRTDLVEEFGRKGIQDLVGHYDRLSIPDCVLITPYLMISFPRAGRMTNHEIDRPISWRKKTEFNAHTGTGQSGVVLYFDKPSVYMESPFAVGVTINTAEFALKEIEEGAMIKKTQEYWKEVSEQLSLLSQSIDHATWYVEQLNNVHNALWADKIQEFKR